MDWPETTQRDAQHEHCWHMTNSPMLIVMKDGYVHQTCCACPATRQIHRDHVGGAVHG